VVRMGGGDLNPHFFYYPSLLMYALLGLQGGVYAIGHLLHAYPSPDSFAVAYLTDSTVSYLVGRALVAVLGAATVGLVFLVGRRFLSPQAALIGAALLAVSPVHVANSHFATNDVPMAFFVLVAYLFLWRVYARGHAGDYVGAGAAIGLGVATKYLPVVLLLSLVLAHAFRLRNRNGAWRRTTADLRWLAAAGAAALATFLAMSPYVLLDWRAALHDYGVQASLSSAQGCGDCTLNLVPYLRHTLGWSIGWPAYLLALAGLVSLLRLRGEARRRAILLASFPLLLLLMIGVQRQPWARWLVPLAPFACLAAGAVLWRVVGWTVTAVAGRRRPAPAARRAAGLAVAVLLVTALPPALASVGFDRMLRAEDPRTSATLWLERTVPSGTTIAVQPLLDRYFLTAQVRTDRELRSIESWLPPGRAAARGSVEREYLRRPVYHLSAFSYSLDSLRAAGVRYVVLSSAHHHQVDPAAEDRLDAELAGRATLVRRFAPPVQVAGADDYPVAMPTITVYAL
jgi:hypothetical protein